MHFSKFIAKIILRHAGLRSTPHRGLSSSACNEYIRVSAEVESAIQNQDPVIALESTIITHGMPAPDNIQVAVDVEDVVRKHNAVPATVAILDGLIHVGISRDQLERLVSCPDAVKVSRRDLAHVLSQKLTGGTTVSATMIASHLAGIPIFVTGGIGGVHKGAETTFDISADLTELGRTPVAVISSGVKSILDIGRTLEYLETQGVYVASFQSDRFPAFFARDSGFKAPYSLKDEKQTAQAIACNLSLGLHSGMLIAVPIPEQAASSGKLIEQTIQQALQEAQEQGIMGKDVTPFVLGRVNNLTKGQSLEANKALIKHNAKVGATIAMELSRLRKQNSKIIGFTNTACGSLRGNAVSRRYYSHSAKCQKPGRPVVVGGAVVDFVTTAFTNNVKYCGATYPGSVKQSFGGVARNVADGLARLGCDPLLISVIGGDFHAETFKQFCKHMDLRGVQRLENNSTPTYCAILKKSGELLFGIGDMELHSAVTPEYISQFEEDISRASIMFVDGNIPAESIECACDICQKHGVPVWFDPTDIHKAHKPFLTSAWEKLTYISPNFNELQVMYDAFTKVSSYTPAADTNLRTISDKTAIEETCLLTLPMLDIFPVIFSSLGENGLLVGRGRNRNNILFQLKYQYKDTKPAQSLLHYPPCAEEFRPNNIVSVSGAGDCMTAATIYSIIFGEDADTSIKAGLLAAQHSLRVFQAVPNSLAADEFTRDKVQAWAPWQPNVIFGNKSAKITAA